MVDNTKKVEDNKNMDGKTIHVGVMEEKGYIDWYMLMGLDTKMGDLFRAYAEDNDIEPGLVSFHVNKNGIKHDNTPWSLNLKDEDHIKIQFDKIPCSITIRK